MKNYLSVILFITFCISINSSFSQDTTNVYNSKYLVDEGVNYHDKGEFDKAMSCYDRINRNDSSWFQSRIEKSLSLLEAKKYDELILFDREILKVPFDRHPYIYLHLGIALDETGKFDESIRVFDEGIAIFPGNFSLNYSKGIILQKKGDLAGAMKSYQNALMANPFHPASHLKLGYLCADRGYYTQAVMSLTGYIMVSGNDSLKLSVLSFLDKYLSEKNSFDEPEIEGLLEKDFAKSDIILGNQLALHRDYKLKSKLDYPVVRQIQALVENLKYNKNSKGFWMQYYVPFYSRIVEEGQLEGFSYMVMSAGTNDKIVKEVKKHSKEIKEFSPWANNAWLKPYERVSLPFNTQKNSPIRVHRDGARIYALSECEIENPRTGDWVFIDEEGALMSKGSFNPKGERDGSWTFYNDNGNISTTVEYKEGKGHGKLVEYDIFGNMTRVAYLNNGSLNGPDVNFFASGDTSAYSNYKDGNMEGKGFTRFANGQTEMQSNYVAGKFEGLIKRFYDNGQLEIEVEFKDGLKNGSFKSYYKNGKAKRTESFIADKSNGLMKEYYNNGQLSMEVMFRDDKYSGLYREWFENGKLREEDTYNEKGNIDGISKIYTKDGILHLSIVYDNGKLISNECFGKDGKQLSKSETKQGKIVYKLYYPEGGPWVEGKFVQGERDGRWIYYDRYGQVEQEENYTDGKLEGPLTEYFPTGKPDKITLYSQGSRDGLYNEYYRNGNNYSTGYYRDGSEAGEWKSFYMDGKLMSDNYYLNGDYSGWQTYHDIFGVVWHEIYYRNGAILRERFYDTLGTVYQDLEVKGYTGVLKSVWPNGKTRSNITLRNGFMDGEYYWNFITGNRETDGQMFNGKRHGGWKHYFISGVLKETGTYEYGNKTGIWIEYYENGNKSSEANFVDNQLDGKYTDYNDNGKPGFEGNYENGKETGIFTYYSYEGEVAYALEYNEGSIVAFSFNGQDGKLKPFTPVSNGTFKLEANFANGKKSVEGQYEKGRYSGQWKWYFSNGKVETELMYIDGGREGERITYYNTGQLKLREMYVNRLKEGTGMYYYLSGKVKKELNYLHDELHGWSKYYDEQGKLKTSRYFYSGELYVENTKP